jgi:hypothetical protein
MVFLKELIEIYLWVSKFEEHDSKNGHCNSEKKL